MVTVLSLPPTPLKVFRQTLLKSLLIIVQYPFAFFMNGFIVQNVFMHLNLCLDHTFNFIWPTHISNLCSTLIINFLNSDIVDLRNFISKILSFSFINELFLFFILCHLRQYGKCLYEDSLKNSSGYEKGVNIEKPQILRLWPPYITL